VIQKRSHHNEKLARIYDDEIAPVWGTRFGKMLLRNLDVPERGQVLDIACGTGTPTIEILRRMREGSRIIAIDPSSAMLDVARKKVSELGPLGKKIYFRTENPVPKLSFADDVYDLVVCNLGLGEMPDLAGAMRDFSRVCKVGGEVRCTLPLAGTFEEFHDLFREVLMKHDRHDALERLDRWIARFPTVDQVEHHMQAAQLSGGLEIEEFTLLFKSSREFFFAPVIEYGPLVDWKEIAGDGQEMQDAFWYIKEAIDAYFDGRPFQVTVKAGCIIGTKVAAPAPVEVLVDDYDADDEIDTGGFVQVAHPSLASGSVNLIVDPDELEVVEEVSVASLADDPEAALDAFIEGKKRPPHLDD
jgi:ubiquinone/menaquinone biosynthesis C-methylase UbiE